MASDLRKQEAGYTAGRREDDQRYVVLCAGLAPGLGGTDA
jgi:hypothetical protein